MRYSQSNAIYILKSGLPARMSVCMYVYVRNAVTFHHCLFLEQIPLNGYAHTTVKCILCVTTYVLVLGGRGVFSV